MKNAIQRRHFIKKSLLGTGGLLLASTFISCAHDDSPKKTKTEEKKLQQRNFNEGVASFDPTQNSVIIWSRYAKTGSIVKWELSKTEDFKEVVADGELVCSSERDNTLAVQVTHLSSNQKYYYRFYSPENEDTSVIGETITLPASNDAVDEVKLGVCSCSNFPAGYFNAYTAMANSDIDVVVHLGDYIYEYGNGEYGTNNFTAGAGRVVEPAHELISLDDYRTRYKQYRKDEDLKYLHQKKPFIAVWDDHEIANDTYMDGAENHSQSEGDWLARKTAALQAYSEYIPITLDKGDNLRIYRSFDFSNIISLHMLDTRVLARDKQLEYSEYLQGGFDLNRLKKDLASPSRKLLGDEQMNWLRNQVGNSNASWQVLGQQVLMARMELPFTVLLNLNSAVTELQNSGEISAATFNNVVAQMEHYAKVKQKVKNGESLTSAEENIYYGPKFPYNLDAWDGYKTERENLYAMLAGKKVVTLAGDTHNAWSSTLRNALGQEVGTEFATGSISSPGMEKYLGENNLTPENLEKVTALFADIIDELNYVNLNRRGYMKVTFTHSNATAEWNFTPSVFEKNTSFYIDKTIVI